MPQSASVTAFGTSQNAAWSQLLQSDLVAYTVVHNGVITQASEAVRQILGYTSPYQQVQGNTWNHIVPSEEQETLHSFFLQLSQPGGRGQHRCNLKLSDGSLMPVVLQGAAILDSDAIKQVVVVYELGPWLGTSLSGHPDLFQAFDPESGFPSAQLLYDRGSIGLALARRYRRRAAILRVRLEHLDALTQNADDAHLALVHAFIADTFRHGVRDSDTVAKLNEADFAIFLPEIRTQDDAGVLAARLVESFAKDIPPAADGTRLSASIGVAVYPADGTDMPSLLAVAETAMLEALGRRGGRFAFAGATSLELQSVSPIPLTGPLSGIADRLDEDHRELVMQLNDIVKQLHDGTSPFSLGQSIRNFSGHLHRHLLTEAEWDTRSLYENAREQNKRDLRFLDELHCILADLNPQSVLLAVHLLREWLATHLSVTQVTADAIR